MRPTLRLAVTALVATVSALTAAPACSHHATTGNATSSGTGNAAAGGTGGDGGAGGASPDAGFDAASGPHASVRVADFALPELLYFDLCFSTDPVGPSASWAGPVLKGSYQSLTSGGITPYFAVAPGTQSLRFVLQDSPDCTQTLAGVPDFAIHEALEAEARSTLVLGGAAFDGGTRPLELFQYTDETEARDAGNIVRFINLAQAESPIDLFLYASHYMQPPCSLIFDDVPYGAFATAKTLPGGGGPTDGNGYSPLVGQNLYDLTFATIAYTAHGGACSSAFGELYTTDGYLAQGAWTVFISDEGSMHLLCLDDGTPEPFCTLY